MNQTYQVDFAETPRYYTVEKNGVFVKVLFDKRTIPPEFHNLIGASAFMYHQHEQLFACMQLFINGLDSEIKIAQPRRKREIASFVQLLQRLQEECLSALYVADVGPTKQQRASQLQNKTKKVAPK